MKWSFSRERVNMFPQKGYHFSGNVGRSFGQALGRHCLFRIHIFKRDVIHENVTLIHE